MIKGPSGWKPVGFAKFDPELTVSYDVNWLDFEETTSGEKEVMFRGKLEFNNELFHGLNHCYIFINFGPVLLPGLSKVMRDKKLTLKPNTSAGTGDPEFNVDLKVDFDKDVGIYYYGEFDCPENPLNEQYTLQIEIDGYDASPHLKTRNPSGDQIDSQPVTTAKVDPNSYPVFNLVNYEPGVDRNHSILIAPAIRSFKEAAELYGFSGSKKGMRQLADALLLGQDPISLQELLKNA